MKAQCAICLAIAMAMAGCRDGPKTRARPAPPPGHTIRSPTPPVPERDASAIREDQRAALKMLAKLSRAGQMSHRAFAALFRVVSRSVVNIFTSRSVRRVNDETVEDSLRRYEEFFGSNARERLQRSLGSGFVIDRKGYVLTNQHVVEGADEIRVRTWTGREVEAKVVGSDAKTDLAIIKIPPAPDLAPVVLGDSTKVVIGDWVAAIGNPFGLSHTMAVGIVSAKGRRSGTGAYGLIQIDATINPGNSGGPLLNLAGEVIGVNTSISALGSGIGFAVPVEAVRQVIPQLKSIGRVVRPWLGVFLQRLTLELALSFGLRTAQGALVSGVTEAGPAAAAGLLQGDVILEFGKKKIRDKDHIRSVVYRTQVGRKVPIVAFREGKRIKLTLEMVPEPAEEKASTTPSKPPKPILGLTLADASADEGSGGVLVQGVVEGSISWEAGLRTDDLVLGINNVPVADLESYELLYALLSPREICRLKLRRRGIEQFVAFRVPPD